MNDEELSLLLNCFPEPQVDEGLLRSYIYEILPLLEPNTLKEYLDNLRRKENGDFIPLSRHASPLNLMAAGRALKTIRNHQEPHTIKKFEEKIKALKRIDNQALDTFGELAVGELIAPLYKFEVDYKTGVEGKSDGKDVDIYIPELDLYCEVKNSGFSRTQKDIRIEALSKNLFSNEITSGSFEIDPRKNYKITEIQNNPNIKSVSTIGGGTTSANFSSLLKNAEKKLDNSQHGVVFITGLVNHDRLVEAIHNWHTGKTEENRIKAVYGLGAVSTRLIRRIDIVELEESGKVEELTKKLGI